MKAPCVELPALPCPALHCIALPFLVSFSLVLGLDGDAVLLFMKVPFRRLHRRLHLRHRHHSFSFREP